MDGETKSVVLFAMTRPRSIPSYFIYGEPERPLEVGFLHVENVQARQSVHRGRVEPHRHEHMGQITLWTEGLGTYRIEDQTWEFAAPAVSFVPSSVVHGFTIEPEADAIVVSVADGLLAGLGGLADGPAFVSGSAGSRTWSDLSAAVHAIAAEYRERLPARDHCLKLLVPLALTYIARLRPVAASQGRQTGHAGLALAFRQLADQHFRNNWRIEEYTLRLGTTHHLLEKAVGEVLGCSLKSAIAARRLVEAQRLLLFTNRSAENIAYELGFKDAGYFSRVFKRQTGEAPGQWRDRRSVKQG